MSRRRKIDFPPSGVEIPEPAGDFTDPQHAVEWLYSKHLTPQYLPYDGHSQACRVHEPDWFEQPKPRPRWKRERPPMTRPCSDPTHDHKNETGHWVFGNSLGMVMCYSDQYMIQWANKKLEEVRAKRWIK